MRIKCVQGISLVGKPSCNELHKAIYRERNVFLLKRGILRALPEGLQYGLIANTYTYKAVILANIRNMAPQDRISAFICGMTAMKGRFYLADGQKLMHDRLILKSAAYELNSRGVDVEVFIGEHYSKQIYDLETRKYDPGMRRP